MSSKLIMKSIPNAIGEIIFTTVVSDVWSIVVKTRPISIINVTTPATAIRPNKAYVLRSSLLPESWLERKVKNAGYKGRMHTAVRGVSTPNTKDMPKSVKIFTILC